MALAAAAELRSELSEARQQQRDLESALSRTQAEFEQLAAQQVAERRQMDEKLAFLETRRDQDHVWYLQRIAEEREEAQRAA